MYISVVKLAVDDIDRAVDFYVNKLGWSKTMDVPMDDGWRWVTVTPEGGQAAFTLSKEEGRTPSPSDAGPGVILEVDDVFKMQEKLKTLGVEIATEATAQPWGGWATFKDSEGNAIGLHSAVPAGVSAN